MARGTVYDKLVGKVDAVEILGDPAQAVEEPERFVKYQNKIYRVAEEVNVGIGGRFAIPAAVSPTDGSQARIPSPNIDQPFLTQRVTIPSQSSLYLLLVFAQVSSIVLIDGDPVCGDIFSEVSLNNGVRWPTIQTGQSVKVDFENANPLAAVEPRMSLTGVRIR